MLIVSQSQAHRYLKLLIHAVQRVRSTSMEGGLTAEHSRILGPEGTEHLTWLVQAEEHAEKGTLGPSGFWNLVHLVQSAHPSLEAALFVQDAAFLSYPPGAILRPWPLQPDS